MAIKIGSNFTFQGKQPNFERDRFATKAAMKAFPETSIDDGHLSYCSEDGNTYQFKSSNAVDAVTGKWRLFKTDIVVDSALNGTSTNPIQNKAVFDALKAKADAVALDKYQPKYDADYIATSDLSILPITTGIIDLNGYQINLPNVIAPDEYLSIRNGIVVFDTTITKIEIGVLNFEKAIISCSDDVAVTLNIYVLECHDVLGLKGLRCNFIGGNSTIRSAAMFNSFIDFALPIAQDIDVYNSTCYINGNVKLTAYNSFVGDKGLSLANGSAWYNTQLDIYPYYNSGWVDEAGKMHCGVYFDDTITGDSDYAPQTKAVYNALQLKADKTQLNDLATKTELNDKADASALNNYVTTATANTTYAKKSDISNVYKFKGTKTNYADLPTTNRVTGDVWNIINADAEHGIKAGDNVAWNGTAWDNLSGTVDLSAYATKEKAFTKDTASTEPGQFVAGPINTRGNISLRKIDISDIPDLRSKYQVIDTGGYQIYPRIAGTRVRPRPINGVMSFFLFDKYEGDQGEVSPDWYYATDGTLQDIKTKIPKVVLDDTVSTTSDNGVKNSVITKYVDGKVTTINDGIVDLRKKVNAIPKTVILTQAAYNALTTKDPNTIYYING